MGDGTLSGDGSKILICSGIGVSKDTMEVGNSTDIIQVVMIQREMKCLLFSDCLLKIAFKVLVKLKGRGILMGIL